MPQVAALAGVSSATFHATVGGKPQLPLTLLDAGSTESAIVNTMQSVAEAVPRRR